MNELIHKIRSGMGGNLAKGSMFVFAGSMVANIGAYLYHLIVGRILGPAGYGELSSLISLLYIFGVSNQVLQTVLVKYFSIFKAKNELGEAKSLLFKSIKYLLILLFFAGVVFGIASPFITSYLNLSQWFLVPLIFVIIGLSTISYINISVIQGFQMFFWFGIFSALGVVLRLGLSIPLSYFGVGWTLVASILALVISFGLSFLPIRFILRSPEKKHSVTKREALAYSIPTLLTLIGITSLYSTDIILVKHFFSPHDAGVYAAIAVLGKIIFYASSAVSLVVFPMLSEKTAKKENTQNIVYLSIGFVLLISLLITALYYIIPVFITHLLFGVAYEGAIPYLGAFALFMTAFSVANVLSFICLAVGFVSIWPFTISAACIQIIMIYIYHSSLSEIITVNTWISIVLSVVLIMYYMIKAKKNTDP